MQQAGDSLRVSGNASFDGGSQSGLLTNGVIEVGGGFTQASSYHAASYAATGSHVTRLKGSGTQTVVFTDTVSSHFANLQLATTDTIAMTGGLKAVGQLISPAAARPVVLGGGAGLTVGGLNVDSLVLDNVLLTSAGDALIKFDNVTFQNYVSATTQLTLRHSGIGSPFTFNGLRFLTTPGTGKYLATR
jgi:hypothetical protein